MLDRFKCNLTPDQKGRLIQVLKDRSMRYTQVFMSTGMNSGYTSTTSYPDNVYLDVLNVLIATAESLCQIPGRNNMTPSFRSNLAVLMGTEIEAILEPPKWIATAEL